MNENEAGTAAAARLTAIVHEISMHTKRITSAKAA